MPYTPSGNWIGPEGSDYSPCPCPACAEYKRRYGITPGEQFRATLVEPEYGDDGFDQFGRDRAGLDEGGYNRDGYDSDGYNRDGYDERGYDRTGFNREGYDRRGYDRTGYTVAGYDCVGRDRNGRDFDGYDVSGYDRDGYDRGGHGRDGYSTFGWDVEGYGRDGYDRHGYNREGRDRDGNERPCDCYACRIEREETPRVPAFTVTDVETPVSNSYQYEEMPRDQEGLRNYTYTPNPLTFYRNHDEDKRTVPFFGMEIEMTSYVTQQEMNIGRKLGLDGGLLYFKQDGSVEGFEMVTHPMTASWAAENFPWQVVEVLAEAGASVEEGCNGLHIHVSRSGFKDEAHLYRWLKLLYRNDSHIIRLAGRSGGEWGSFDNDCADLHRVHAKARMRKRHAKGDMYLRGAETGDRYNAVNLQNEHTVEVRICAATTSAEVLRKRFDMVAASVEYTRNMTVKDAVKGGWKWDTFILWLDQQGSDYPALVSSEATRILDAIGRREAARNQPSVVLA